MAELYIEKVPEYYKGEYPAIIIKHKPSQDIIRLESEIREAVRKWLAGEVSHG